MPVPIGQGFSRHAIDLGGPPGLLEEALSTARDDTPTCVLESSIQCVACAHFLPWVCRTSGRNAKRSCRNGPREGFRMADLFDEWQSFCEIASPHQVDQAIAHTHAQDTRQAVMQAVAAAAAAGR